MGRENNTGVKRSCVTCKHGIPCAPQEYTVTYYTEEVTSLRTFYHCAKDAQKECQGGFELGKMWEDKEE